MKGVSSRIGAGPRRRTVAMLALALAACAPASPAGPWSRAALPAAGKDFFAYALARSTDLGPVDPGSSVSLTLTLRNPREARQAADTAAMYDRTSPSYLKFLTPAEVAARYGPDPAVAGSVVSWVRAHGLDAVWHAGNPSVSVSGPARLVDTGFAVTIHRFRAPDGKEFYASARDPVIPADLGGAVAGTSHVTSFSDWHAYAVPAKGLPPPGLLTAYDIQPLRDKGVDGTGETVVFWSPGPGGFDGYSPDGFSTFNKRFGLPDVQPVLKGGPNGSYEGEIQMDLEVVHSIAPGAKLVVYTTDGNTALNSMFTDFPGVIFNNSWGGCETQESPSLLQSANATFTAAAMTGASIFASTGDSGGYTCLTKNWGSPPSPDAIGASFPACLPFVTAVGGTRISVRQDNSYFDETVWEQPGLMSGGGGNISSVFPKPDWQTGPGVSNQFNSTMRSIPDVSADADPASGMTIFDPKNVDPASGRDGWSQGGGTSQSSPIWAGVTALINQFAKSNGGHSVGFFNPMLYALAQNPRYSSSFHDVTVGTNLVYPATPGYDLATGLGTPDVWTLAQSVVAYEKGVT